MKKLLKFGVTALSVFALAGGVALAEDELKPAEAAKKKGKGGKGQSIEKMVAKLDKNDDKKLSFDEWKVRFAKAKKPRTDEQLKKTFGKVDANSDTFATVEELTAAQTKQKERAAKRKGKAGQKKKAGKKAGAKKERAAK